MECVHRVWLSLTAGVFAAAVMTPVASALHQLPQTPDLRGDSGDNEQREGQAIQYLRAFTASKIEGSLPDLPLGVWIEQILGRQTSWELNDCGEGPRLGPVPLCVGIEDASRQLILLVAIGNSERGITDPPSLFFGTIKLFDIDRGVRRLGELPALLTEAAARREMFQDHPLRDIAPLEAARVGRTVLAQLLDDTLPREPFEVWMKNVMPSDSMIAWLRQPCNGWNTQPACVIVEVTWSDQSRALVVLDLEMVQRGLTEVPRFVSASLYDRSRGRIDTFGSLSDLERAVRSVRERERR
jgi:hypothetical protein